LKLDRDKSRLIKWSEWLDDTRVSTTTTLDQTSWRQISFSSDGALATLTTNHQVLIFEPEKDFIKGEYVETFDLTSHEIEQSLQLQLPKKIELGPKDRQSMSSLLNKVQATSIDWGSNSMLAVGHKSGEITLWNYKRKQTEFFYRFRPTNTNDKVNWINLLKWDNKNRRLAIGDSDGRIWVQTIHDKDCISVQDDDDKRTVSQFCWIDTDTLAYSKLGTINLVKLSSSSSNFENFEISLELPNPNPNDNNEMLWSGSSNYSTCCGLVVDHSNKHLLIYLSCGLIYKLDLDLDTDYHSLASQILPCFDQTIQARKVYEKMVSPPSPEGVFKLTKNQGPKLTGVVPFQQQELDGQVVVGMIFESTRPDLFSYHPPSTLKTHFVLTKLISPSPSGESESESLSLLKSIEKEINNDSSLLPPHQSLLLILDSIHSHVDSFEFVESLIKLLQQPPRQPLAAVVEESDTSINYRVNQSLNKDSELIKLRKKFTIIQKLSQLVDSDSNSTGTGKKKKKERIQRLKSSLSRELTRTVCFKFSQILSKIDNLSEIEKSVYLTRLLLASSALPPIDSTEEEEEEDRDPESLSTSFELNKSVEFCPACQSTIPFSNVRYATCSNKQHVWERCSISLELIGARGAGNKLSEIKTCSNCEKKALSNVNNNNDDDDCERVNEMLKAVNCCAFCGGRWIKIR
jgi:hypothetical protein